MTTAPLPSSHATQVGLRWGVLLSVLLPLIGLALSFALLDSTMTDHGSRSGHNIFYGLFAEHEPVACGLALLGIALLAWVWQRRLEWNPPLQGPRTLWLVAAAVTALTAVGTFAIGHRYGLSMDEYCADFQARIFAHGQTAAVVPEEWRQIERWLRPGFIVHDREHHTWVTAYLPVYAAMRAVFHPLDAQWLLNPLLAGLSIVAIAGVARRVWPESPSAMWLAVGLLATSPQFLINAMTAYSMPAHLALNLVWLWLYSREDKTGLALAPLVGFFATGLHQPNVHLLFALPFCARLVWQRRWGWAAYYLSAYLLTLGACWSWWHWMRPGAVEDSAGAIVAPTLQQGLIQPLNLVLIHSWQSLATLALAALGISRWKTLPTLVRDAAWSCALTFGFYIAFGSHQGHGWGYRYFHSALGCWVLLAAAGWKPLCELFGDGHARALAAGSIVFSLVLGLPLRAMQVEAFVRPYADADAALRTVKAEVVLIPPRGAWYAGDLVRNDPLFRETPKRARFVYVRGEVAQVFKERGRVVVISGEQLERFGLRSANSDQ